MHATRNCKTGSVRGVIGSGRCRAAPRPRPGASTQRGWPCIAPNFSVRTSTKTGALHYSAGLNVFSVGGVLTTWVGGWVGGWARRPWARPGRADGSSAGGRRPSDAARPGAAQRRAGRRWRLRNEWRWGAGARARVVRHRTRRSSKGPAIPGGRVGGRGKRAARTGARDEPTAAAAAAHDRRRLGMGARERRRRAAPPGRGLRPPAFGRPEKIGGRARVARRADPGEPRGRRPGAARGARARCRSRCGCLEAGPAAWRAAGLGGAPGVGCQGAVPGRGGGRLAVKCIRARGGKGARGGPLPPNHVRWGGKASKPPAGRSGRHAGEGAPAGPRHSRQAKPGSGGARAAAPARARVSTEGGAARARPGGGPGRRAPAPSRPPLWAHATAPKPLVARGLRQGSPR
jgi:hypothetical protein